MIASGKPPFEFECRPCVDQEDMGYKNTCMTMTFARWLTQLKLPRHVRTWYFIPSSVAMMKCLISCTRTPMTISMSSKLAWVPSTRQVLHQSKGLKRRSGMPPKCHFTFLSQVQFSQVCDQSSETSFRCLYIVPCLYSESQTTQEENRRGDRRWNRRGREVELKSWAPTEKLRAPLYPTTRLSNEGRERNESDGMKEQISISHCYQREILFVIITLSWSPQTDAAVHKRMVDVCLSVLVEEVNHTAVWML